MMRFHLGCVAPSREGLGYPGNALAPLLDQFREALTPSTTLLQLVLDILATVYVDVHFCPKVS